MNIKRINLIAALVILALAEFSTCACKPTPITPVVISKTDTYQESTSSGISIEVPDSIQQVYDGFPNLEVVFDAVIAMPDTSIFPVVKVSKRKLFDEDISKLVELCLGTKDNQLSSNWQLSRAEWLTKLIDIQEHDSSEIVRKDYIEYLQDSFDNASESTNITYTQLHNLPNDRTSTVYTRNNDTYSRFDFSRTGNRFIYSRDIFTEVYSESMLSEDQFDPTYETREQFEWRKPTTPQLDIDAAQNIAQTFMGQFEIDLELFRAEPCSVITNGISKRNGWMLTYTRKIENLQSQYSDIGTYLNPDSLPSYVAPWQREVLQVAIDEDGISYLRLQGASIIKERIASNAVLLPFEQIQSRIAQQLNYVYGTHLNGNNVGLELTVTKIELGISLLTQKDEMDTGVYLPTWYVSFNRKWQDESTDLPSGEIMFSAIDGRYIEPRVTKQQIMS